MSDTKFTKGEWYCVLGDTYACVRINGKVIADLRTVNTAYNKYDAHLIKAAPKMYAEIEDLEAWLKYHDDYKGWHARVEKLLAEARGEL